MKQPYDYVCAMACCLIFNSAPYDVNIRHFTLVFLGLSQIMRLAVQPSQERRGGFQLFVDDVACLFGPDHWHVASIRFQGEILIRLKVKESFFPSIECRSYFEAREGNTSF